jgi:SAM-dependent methyltransferase
MEDWVDRLYAAGIPHNKFSVPLPDGTYYPDLMFVEDVRPIEFLSHFDRVRSKSWDQCSFLDLGCSEGSTTLALSQMGSTVYGVEGRADGVARAQMLKKILNRETVHFSVENVNSDAAFIEVDGIFNAGILYHLDDPITFLERTCRCAREFVLIDTAHAPADDEEMNKSKFRTNLGKRYELSYGDLKLLVQDFAEPSDPREKDDKGNRRGPRSGIGNTNSVWLTHESLVSFMKERGFHYFEKTSFNMKISRHRTCFFREKPRPVERLELTHPLPSVLRREDAVQRAAKRDIEYLRIRGEPVIVVGREPIVSAVCERLTAAHIQIAERIVFSGEVGDRIPIKSVAREMAGMSGVIVTAEPEPVELVRWFVKLDRFSLALTSLGTHVHLTDLSASRQK